jgi:hypothetical protein
MTLCLKLMRFYNINFYVSIIRPNFTTKIKIIVAQVVTDSSLATSSAAAHDYCSLVKNKHFFELSVCRTPVRSRIFVNIKATAHFCMPLCACESGEVLFAVFRDHPRFSSAI